jgi:uroporphyrinogen decarboxylase
MTGKNLVLEAMRNRKTERTPYVPFVGVHGASLLGESADEYLKSDELMLKGIEKAVELYQPDGLPVCFDLQIEAEILGCRLIWARENPPAVATHVLQEKKLSELPSITDKLGRIPVVMNVTRTVTKRFPDTAFYGLITGPFTLALHLMGPEIFMDMYDKPDYVKEVMRFCTDVAKRWPGTISMLVSILLPWLIQ